MQKLAINNRGPRYLSDYLKAKSLLDDEETNDQIMHNSLQEIITLFGVKEMLEAIICNTEKLRPIIDIISKEKRKDKEEQSSKLQQHDHEENEQFNSDDEIDEMYMLSEQKQNKKSLLLSLPNESISHICQYLENELIYEFNHFKTVSRQIAIVCLDYMTKVKISVYNMNSLLKNDNECLSLWNMECNLFMRTRYHCSSKYSFIYQDWEDKYNIPQNFQLIFSNIGKGNSGMASAHLIDSDGLRSQKIKKNRSDFKYFIVDKRNVIFLDDNNQKKLTQCDEIHCRYKFFILEYFDVLNQEISAKQFILYDGDLTYARISKYIQTQFIPIDSISNEWYNELKEKLNLMSAYDQGEKISFYRHGPKGGLSRTKYHHKLYAMKITFQLNNKHKWMKKNKLDECKNMFHQNMIKFYDNTKLFYPFNKKKLQLLASHEDEKNMLKKCVKVAFNESAKLDFILNVLERGQYVKVKQASYFTEIQTKIVELFDNMIPKQNIILTENLYGSNRSSILAFNDKFYGSTIKYILLLFDAKFRSYNLMINKNTFLKSVEKLKS